MYDGTIKIAKDVKIGDFLMGDDSTLRRVEKLYRGIQEMYQIILEDGTTYIGNAEHRMALISTFDGEIYYDENSQIYQVMYHKFKNGLIKKYEKYFISEDIPNSKYVNEYLSKKRNKKNVITKGNIIPIKIIDYISLDENIKKYYKQFRNVIKFSETPVIIDPYQIGYKLTPRQNIATKYKFNSYEIRSAILAGLIDKYGKIINLEIFLQIDNDILFSECILLCQNLGIKIEMIGKYTIKINEIPKMITLPTEKLDTKIIKKSEYEDKTIYDFRINKLKTDKFYGFTIDKNERYILGNAIVTYNSNGKSLLMELVRHTFGDYYKSMDPTVLTTKKKSSSNATPELADKKNIRVVFLSEPEEDDKIYSSNMKKLTSGLDEICVRQLYETGMSFIPQFKMVMICNDLPSIYGKDEGTWRRIRVIPFNSKFVDGEPIGKNQFKKDKKLKYKIKNWKQAFMWLLIKKYYPQYKKYGLMEPESVKLQTNKYRHDNDFFKEFLDSTYDITTKPDDFVSLMDCYRDFKLWFRDMSSGYRDTCPSIKVMRNYMERSDTLKFEDNKIYGIKYKELVTNDNDT